MERRRRSQLLFLLAIFALLLSHCTLVLSSSGDGLNKKPSTPTPGNNDDEDEDISFLEEPLDTSPSSSSSHAYDTDSDDEHNDDFDQGSYEEPPPPPPVDDKDVVVLTQANFSDFLSSNKHVMVEFYAPWCGHCQALAPEYAAAATDLKGHDVVLAKVDATEENDLTQKYEIQGFPTVLLFLEGVQKTYTGQRTKDGIVTWIKKKIGPGLHDVKTAEEAQKILTGEAKLAVAFVNSLDGTESQELTAASKLEDDVNFYQTTNPDVAQIFSIDPKAKRPSLVLLKKESEKIIHFDGKFTKSAIADFIFVNKMPLVTPFTRESAQLIFNNPIKKQLLLFSTSNGSAEVLPIFEEAAKAFKGKLIFVYVEMDNEDVGVPVSNYFGVTGEDPTVVAYTGNDDAKKYILKDKVSLDSIKVFGEGFLQDNLKPFYKSDPIPDKNDGDVIVVVGNNCEDIVLDESKDVLLEIYAPWCGHCQALEPTYNKLAKHLRNIDSLVIAKMDGTTNEHPRAKADGFPTLLFFPAGNKSFEPLTVETDRTVVALYKFIKKHASVPFKLQKPAPAENSDNAGEAAAVQESKKNPRDALKDEL